MRIKFLLGLFKAIFILGVLIACCFFAFEHYIIGIALLVLVYLFDFVFRRCPYCGNHISITAGKLDHCPFCGKSFLLK